MKGLSTLYDNSENAHNDDIFKSAISILRQLASTTDEKTLQLNSNEIIGDIINEEKVALLQNGIGKLHFLQNREMLTSSMSTPAEGARADGTLPAGGQGTRSGQALLDLGESITQESYVRMLFPILLPKGQNLFGFN